jgi:hypothetical protein
MEHNDNYENGFLYAWIKKLFNILDKLNFVEKFKDLIWWIVSRKLFKIQKTKENERRIKSIAIDLYKLLKLTIIISIWIFKINTIWVTVITFYLIITTLMTYLKYHFWERNTNNNYERNRRRFVSMILSFTFIIIVYGYLYDVPFKYTITKDTVSSIQSTVYVNDVPMKNEEISWDEALLYSISNAFGGNYSNIVTVNKAGDWLSISQIIITFNYLTIIFAKSLLNERD